MDDKVKNIECALKTLSERVETLYKDTEDVKEDVQYVTTALDEKIATQQSLLDICDVLDDLEYDLSNLGHSIANYQTLHERVLDLEYDVDYLQKQLEKLRAYIRTENNITLKASIVYTTIFSVLNTGVWFLCYSFFS